MIGVVRIPNYWTTPVLESGSFDLRIIKDGTIQAKRSRDTGGSELLVAMFSRDLGKLSDEHYGISTDGQFRVREVPAAEWDAAGEPLTVRYFPNASPPTSEPIPFRYSGQSWGWLRVAQAPDQPITAIVSVTVLEEPVPFFIGSLHGRYRGTAYLELFETSSQKKLAAAEMDYTAEVVFDLAAWIDSRVFVLPLDSSENMWLMALAPAQ